MFSRYWLRIVLVHPVDVIITIRPQPVILPAQTWTRCSGVAIGAEILLLPANTPAGTIFNWPLPVISDATVQGTAGVNVAADPLGKIHINDTINNLSGDPITATYTVTPVSSFGCQGTPTSVVITVNPEPVPQVISGRDKICVGDKNVLYNVSAVSGSSFHWTVDAAVGYKNIRPAMQMQYWSMLPCRPAPETLPYMRPTPTPAEAALQQSRYRSSPFLLLKISNGPAEYVPTAHRFTV